MAVAAPRRSDLGDSLNGSSSASQINPRFLLLLCLFSALLVGASWRYVPAMSSTHAFPPVPNNGPFGSKPTRPSRPVDGRVGVTRARPNCSAADRAAASAAAAAGDHRYVFVHVPKAGGTAFDVMMGRTFAPLVDLRRRGCLAAGSGPQYIGFHHADMSFVEGGCTYPVLERSCRRGPIRESPAGAACRNSPVGCPQPRTLLLLRRPLDRFVSHTFFTRFRKFAGAEARVRELKILENMLLYHAWHPGGSALHYSVGFVTGTNMENEWVAHRAGRVLDESQKQRRQQHLLDYRWVCDKAKDVIRELFWMGLLETLPRDLQRLAGMANLSLPLAMPSVNSNHKRARDPHPPLVVLAFSTLAPLEVWLYEYAQHVVSPSPGEEPPACPTRTEEDVARQLAMLERVRARVSQLTSDVQAAALAG